MPPVIVRAQKIGTDYHVDVQIGTNAVQHGVDADGKPVIVNEPVIESHVWGMAPAGVSEAAWIADIKSQLRAKYRTRAAPAPTTLGNLEGTDLS